jgi:hypothetical protein
LIFFQRHPSNYKKTICRFHLNEHQDLLNAELHPLIDQLNSINDRFNGIDIDRMIGDSCQKLEQCRDQYCNKIKDEVHRKMAKFKVCVGCEN